MSFRVLEGPDTPGIYPRITNLRSSRENRELVLLHLRSGSIQRKQEKAR